MTDEDFKDMVKKLPKFLLNDEGSLFRIICENCGCEWGCKDNIENFKCGVCLRFEELYPKYDKI